MNQNPSSSRGYKVRADGLKHLEKKALSNPKRVDRRPSYGDLLEGDLVDDGSYLYLSSGGKLIRMPYESWPFQE